MLAPRFPTSDPASHSVMRFASALAHFWRSLLLGGALLAGSGTPAPAAGEVEALFEAEIAPLFAKHYLECHDSRTMKGKLDLSRRDKAMAGGKSGLAIIPGKSEKSLLWESVHSGEMPEDRPPLSTEEKQALRKWIDAGAVWASETIDPLAYERDRRATQNWAWRLTVPEYIETVRSAVGVDIEKDADRILPPDTRADGFSNTAYNLNIDLGHVEAYAHLAEIIVARMDVVKFAAGFVPSQEFADESMRELISKMGKWLLRGPLEKQEVDAFAKIPQAISKAGGDFKEAVACVIEAMLQSPRFIYRIENHRGDGQPRRVGEFELASRLSYMIWGAPPDKELMRAAQAGELADDGQLESQVQRMLGDPRALKRSREFVHEWLDLGRLSNLRPDRKRFPQWNEQLAADMREETLEFFEEVAWRQKRPLADLLNAKVTFATGRLARHYGLNQKVVATSGDEKDSENVEPVTDGLQALYTFEEGSGSVVRDRSNRGEPLDLKIEKESAVKWSDSGLTVSAPTWIAATKSPKRLIDAAKKSNAFTLEAWVTPAEKNQTGPARILTLSSGPSLRNFTLGQDRDRFDVRFRSSKNDGNGMPSLSSPDGAVKTEMMHVIHTRDAAGKVKLYVNGEEKASGEAGGDLSNRDDSFRFGLANETTNDRPWRGVFHRIAIYSRALNADEVRRNHAAGPRVDSGKLARYDLRSVPARGGLLTQGSLLTIGGDNASMVTRGLFILHDLLYSKVGSAPPGTDTRPVPPKPGMSRRAVAETRIADASCVSCHARFEPLAYGLEKFDGIGAHHEVDEHGNNLREDGEILFPGEEKATPYATAAELMELLAKSDRVRKNITRKLAQFSIGRPLIESDAHIIDDIHAKAQKAGGTYMSLISALATSDLVQMTRTEPTEIPEKPTP